MHGGQGQTAQEISKVPAVQAEVACSFDAQAEGRGAHPRAPCDSIDLLLAMEVRLLLDGLLVLEVLRPPIILHPYINLLDLFKQPPA